MAIISAGNIVFGVAAWGYVILTVILCTAAQFALDGLLALIINKLPDRYFGVDHPWYTVSERESRFYQKIKVKKWKDRVWELGELGGFSKRNLEAPGSAAYIAKFIIECNKGVLTHRLSYFIGFLPMGFLPQNCAFSIALPVATVNLFLNILPTLVLRYNTPKLKRMLLRMERKNIITG